MVAYCYNIGGDGGVGADFCIDIPDVVELPPETPVDTEEDPTGEVTLPDGTTSAATAINTPLIGIKQVAWQSSPWKCLWAVRTDGMLLSCTYDKTEDVWAWARHPMSNGAVTSICVIPTAGSDQEELWAVVKRVFDGVTYFYIERMTPRIQPTATTDKSRYNFLDCSLSYSGAPATSFTGANHLPVGNYRVWADGVDMGDIALASGAFTLPVAASEVTIGIQTDAVLISLPTVALATERQIVQEVIIRFFETLGGSAGQLHGQMDELQFRRPDTPMDDSPPLWNGDMTVIVGGRHDDAGVYTIIQDTAGPMTILATFPKYKGT